MDTFFIGVQPIKKRNQLKNAEFFIRRCKSL